MQRHFYCRSDSKVLAPQNFSRPSEMVPLVCSAPLSLRGSEMQAQETDVEGGLVWFDLVSCLTPVGIRKISLSLRDAAQTGTTIPGCSIIGKRQKTVLQNEPLS